MRASIIMETAGMNLRRFRSFPLGRARVVPPCGPRLRGDRTRRPGPAAPSGNPGVGRRNENWTKEAVPGLTVGPWGQRGVNCVI